MVFLDLKKEFVLDIVGKSIQDEEFSNWLQQKKYGVGNAARLLVECYLNFQ